MSDVEFYGENESGGASGSGGSQRFTPQQSQQSQQWQGQAGGRGMIGMIMRWFGITNEAVANYILIGAAVAFFVAALIIFLRT